MQNSEKGCLSVESIDYHFIYLMIIYVISTIAVSARGSHWENPILFSAGIFKVEGGGSVGSNAAPCI